ncbi:MAG: DNA alkylation repair protein [Hoeflea sp.]|uniref:DNA alkylation repair protein n=1 Tax=Hoeflea sp. TaxID=1940281 RepID=UPI001DC521D6|nr:DNA alkylation repair protein [Hoeflea sp.]MBU4530556.1 DNA alkylation repair protein [Alphaproteobacteria bacterium]MBU4545343.1 DNA alkylation repair protein [Alphaproteobacteria bacterium]MBU4548992.1 DNA alkylation repair protein [Alphaproteobacteria bacterium]MBV1722147.1 DNA alkylation repair protein [Hoeflea sp.]MBV1761497.1 DNA alkylation repair protein [Hoeflea sp.]
MAPRRPPENADHSVPDILAWLEEHGSADNVAGMARYGINTARAFGVGNADLRPFSKTLGRNHERALALWRTGYREARLLALFTDEPKRVSPDQAREIAADFDSWEIVDTAADLFVEAGHLDELVPEFAADDREFVRRTAFAMIASGAVHLKTRDDADFLNFLPLIEQHARDPRNFVRKAVNWALRNIGKRSLACHGPALALAEKLAASQDKTARWIGKDAVRELADPDRVAMIGQKKTPGNRRTVLGKP